MADCTATLSVAGVPSLPVLGNDTLTPVAFTRTTCASFRMTFDVFTIVDFAANILPSISTAFAYTARLYRVTTTAIEEIANASSAEQAMAFSKEFTAGTYVLCFQTSTPATFAGTILASFRGYQKFASISLSLSEGCGVQGTFDSYRPPVDCSATLYYEMIDGSLPPGMRMTALGQIRGTAPNLDCIEDTADLPPSQNWSFEHNDGTFHPWGRQWRFKVRVTVDGMPDVFDEEWFCVAVHNNWSLDRDAFVANAPFSITTERVESVEPVLIPEICDPVVVAPAWQPTTIVRPWVKDATVVPFEPVVVVKPCVECTGLTEVMDAIPIPFGAPVINLQFVLAWLEEVRIMADGRKEFLEFLERLEASPVVQQFFAKKPVSVGVSGQNITFKTYSDDPNLLFWKWRAEQNTLLPWYALVVCGEAMAINITHESHT